MPRVPLTTTDVRSAVHELLERNPPRAEDGPLFVHHGKRGGPGATRL